MIDQFKLTFRGTHHPPVWIRIEVDQNMTFRGLHELIQAAFDWGDIMLHDFEVPNPQNTDKQVGGLDLNHLVEFAVKYMLPTKHIGPADDFDDAFDEILDEEKCKLKNFLKNPGDKAVYTYDFEEDWEVNVRLEEKHRAEKNISYPRCIKVSRGYVDFMTEQGEWTRDHPDVQSADVIETNPKAWVKTVNQSFRKISLK
ncbi:plasmid pRiA4b ORF-3 family protein [Sporolactobacillus sp. Y61]|jgi:hypothetical protein|uniref:Plasmid pRiA4b ORF-3 family protein n=1 Tax=Sporolactobacillus sp. Y61 TaxID=3160863 RepID=A0AAU8IBC2_9BACL|nr:plasmid pRiA4b ORF-3 family protein [Sporolactobacillus sp. THM19-2]RYL93664.1 plasmid pRiA4b ORF-3 family protein [Sporolactobacillus sp. THM19-2]